MKSVYVLMIQLALGRLRGVHSAHQADIVQTTEPTVCQPLGMMFTVMHHKVESVQLQE